MPLIQDNSRGGGPGGGVGGGAKSEHRRSLAEFIGLDRALLEMSPPTHSSNPLDMNGNGDMEWLWDQPGSPEVAQTPRALVPPRCFPPRHSRDFASFSESARPGQSWSDDTGSSGQGITDLVASLKALAIPEPAPRHRVQSYSQTIHLRLSCDKNSQGESGWPHDLNSSDAVNGRDEAKLVQRRASFCGVVPSSRHSKEALSWDGTLPPRCPDPNSGFSAKVFLGGLPWDITEQALMHTLRHFQPVRVEWPEREHSTVGGSGCPRGFAYVTFESERRVRALLAASRSDGNDWYYRVQSRKMRSKEVQVIPWSVSDSSWVGCGSARLEPKRTVFVGALHGMLSAAALARIMDDLFTGVVYAGIDTDKNKYPIGSGRVTFNNVRSYIRAISAGYVKIHTDKFIKKVQVLPYLEDSMCSVCNLQQGPYFCREPTCYRYFCRSCWTWQHPNDEHRPLMRNSKSQPHFPHAASIGNSLNGSVGSRHSPPSDQGSVFNIGYNGNMDGTPSPTMSGSSYEPVTGSSSEEPDLPPPWANIQ